jgi:manganese-dependent inorganic pyrophosphatase
MSAALHPPRQTLVIGHRNPDTDAVCSAIAYAWLLRELGDPGATAACCGEINVRTQFVLAEAGLDAPPLVMDVRPTVGSVARRKIIAARRTEPLYAVYRRMQQNHVRALPVLDDDDSIAGIASFARLMELVLPDHDIDAGARIVQTRLDCVREVLEGSFAHVHDSDRTEELVVTVAAMSAEGFDRRMREFPAPRTIVVAGDRPTVQIRAIDYGVRCLVVTGGYALPDELLAKAAGRGVCVLLSPHDTATTTLLIRSSKVIGTAVAPAALSFPESAALDQVAKQVAGSSQELFPVLDEGGRLSGVFTKSDLVDPPRRRLILVDHNELAQAVAGADQADIAEVIDHHRLGGGLISREPIRFINEPLGSTCTIVAKFLSHRNLVPPRPIGLCLLAGIVSDTLNLSSPTTTGSDREFLAWLGLVCGVDPGDFARRLFAAGSALESATPGDAVALDSKIYEEAGRRFAISQVEELGLAGFEGRKAELREALSALARRERLDVAGLLVTDITRGFSLLMLVGDREVIDAVDYPEREPGLFELEGVVSRKKQLLPHLLRVLARLAG